MIHVWIWVLIISFVLFVLACRWLMENLGPFFAENRCVEQGYHIFSSETGRCYECGFSNKWGVKK